MRNFIAGLCFRFDFIEKNCFRRRSTMGIEMLKSVRGQVLFRSFRFPHHRGSNTNFQAFCQNDQKQLCYDSLNLFDVTHLKLPNFDYQQSFILWKADVAALIKAFSFIYHHEGED